MDIIAHGLWAGAAYKAVNNKHGNSNPERRLKIGWAVFWGVFPDLFAFTIPFVLLLWDALHGGFSFTQFRHPDAVEPSSADALPPMHLASTLYNYSHSLIIFLVVFVSIAVWQWRRKKRIPWEMGGWLLHILIDVPTHTYRFYPTPILWPLSRVEFSGISWAVPWFMITNYTAILCVYIFLYRAKLRRFFK